MLLSELQSLLSVLLLHSSEQLQRVQVDMNHSFYSILSQPFLPLVIHCKSTCLVELQFLLVFSIEEVLNFMWLKFFLIWRYFRLWSLIGGIEVPENMPRCINNCYNLESFWKNWHASFNKWLVRYMYIPLGGSRKKLLNMWVVFTFVAVWHDLEWKLLSWAWLTCLFFIPELIVKSAVASFKAKNAFGEFFVRELSAVSGAITITCLMVANLVGYVIGPSGINWLVSRFLQKDGLPILGGLFTTFYVGTKLMFHIEEAKERGL